MSEQITRPCAAAVRLGPTHRRRTPAGLVMYRVVWWDGGCQNDAWTERASSWPQGVGWHPYSCCQVCRPAARAAVVYRRRHPCRDSGALFQAVCAAGLCPHRDGTSLPGRVDSPGRRVTSRVRCFYYSKCCLALLAHPLQDFTLITALGALAVWMYDTPLPLVVAVVAWPVYWFVQVGGVVLRKPPR